MLGIRQPSDAGLEYCATLMTEYTALDCAQVLTLLKRYGGISRHDRNHIVKLLCRGHAKKVEAGERSYFVRRPLRVEGPLLLQVRCFWVLLDYLDRVNHHCAANTPSGLISMEIGGRDYSVLYVPKGKERMCSYSMERGGRTRYFVMVEDLAQIPLIRGTQIHAFALLDERNAVRYYAAEKEGE